MIGISTFGIRKIDDLIDLIKILIIIFISIALLGNFYSFFNVIDSLVYGITTLGIVNGSYEYTINFLHVTGLC